jgi:hypothetical protein
MGLLRRSASTRASPRARRRFESSPLEGIADLSPRATTRSDRRDPRRDSGIWRVTSSRGGTPSIGSGRERSKGRRPKDPFCGPEEAWTSAVATGPVTNSAGGLSGDMAPSYWGKTSRVSLATVSVTDTIAGFARTPTVASGADEQAGRRRMACQLARTGYMAVAKKAERVGRACQQHSSAAVIVLVCPARIGLLSVLGHARTSVRLHPRASQVGR